MRTEPRNDAVAVTTRQSVGTTASRHLRASGKVPATLGGHGSVPLSIAIDAKRLEELLAAGARHRLLAMTIDGSSKDTAMIREIARDPITRRIIHADFQRVSAQEEISASLQVVTVGTPAGVRDGGVLDVVTHELEIRGPANAMPERLEVDVSELGIRHHITAAQVTLPAGFALLTPPETTVATVEPPRAAEEVAVTPEAEAAVPTVAETTPAEEE